MPMENALATISSRASLEQMVATGIPITDLMCIVRQLLSIISDPMFLDPATSRVRVALESAAVTLTGITTVATVTTVTSMTNLAGYSAKDTLLNSNEDQVWAGAIRSIVT